ncbi:spindly [Artemisia annua]|uniref:Spindly n=1 Tax=Artemisia annua TaxID=35608 RepID=A0A2U1P8P3_ARTAN|nr:spindly [Artemisia annua]
MEADDVIAAPPLLVDVPPLQTEASGPRYCLLLHFYDHISSRGTKSWSNNGYFGTILFNMSSVLKIHPDSRNAGQFQTLASKPFCCDSVRQRYLSTFEQLGLESLRVDLLPLILLNHDHMQTYSLMDISLDTFPYAGTTNTRESLYMGVPCVTLGGSVHAHNVGVSLLSAIVGWSPGYVARILKVTFHLKSEWRCSRIRIRRHKLPPCSPKMTNLDRSRKMEVSLGPPRLLTSHSIEENGSQSNRWTAIEERKIDDELRKVSSGKGYGLNVPKRSNSLKVHQSAHVESGQELRKNPHADNIFISILVLLKLHPPKLLERSPQALRAKMYLAGDVVKQFGVKMVARQESRIKTKRSLTSCTRLTRYSPKRICKKA